MANTFITWGQLVVDFKEQNSGIVAVLSAKYKAVCSECNSGRDKELAITLTPAQETQIKNFAKNVILPQIKQAEGIT